MAAEPGLTLRYVTRFRCIGSDCEDHCCHGWQVTLDQQTHDDLQRVSAAVPAEAERFRSRVTLNPATTASRESFATIALAPDGCCPYLAGTTGLCTIHGTHGESLLSPVCSIYPRQLNRCGNRTELSLSLSCPEAARLCLAGAGALEQVVLPDELVANPKYFITHEVAADDPDPYVRYGDLAREVMWQFLGLIEYPLASRLFFVAYFADRVTPYFHRGTRNFDVNLLADEIDRLARPEVLAESHLRFRKMEIGGPLAMQVVLSILGGRGQRDNSLGPLLAEIWRGYGAEPGSDFGDLGARFAARRDRLEPILGNRHEEHLTNYCLNYLFRVSATAAPNLMVHLQSLFVRRAILRFLVFSDPRCDAVSAGGTMADFDALAVDVFYRFSRAIEHDPALTAEITSSLAEQNLQGLAHLVLLLKV
jgi:lysine-N-methylase